MNAAGVSIISIEQIGLPFSKVELLLRSGSVINPILPSNNNYAWNRCSLNFVAFILLHILPGNSCFINLIHLKVQFNFNMIRTNLNKI